MSDTSRDISARINEALQTKYPVELHFVPEEGGQGYYLAFLPDFGFSACSATGDSPEEALASLSSVRAAVIQHYVEAGKVLPEPSSSPANAPELQQMPVRIPRDIHDRLKGFARESGLSLNTYLLQLFSEHVLLRSVEGRLDRLLSRFVCPDQEAPDSWPLRLMEPPVVSHFDPAMVFGGRSGRFATMSPPVRLYMSEEIDDERPAGAIELRSAREADVPETWEN